MKNLLLIYNPRAGKNSSRGKYDDILRIFREYGFNVTEKLTTCVGDATQIVKNNYKGKDLIACCGGDGTFNETVNGVASAGIATPVMYIPMGSTNDLANTIGLSKNVRDQIELYNSGVINTYDIGKFNDVVFTYIASFGVGVDSSYSTSQKAKNLLGHAAYYLDGFVFRLPHHIRNLKPHRMRIEYDGSVIEDDFFFGAITNTNIVSGLFKYDNLGIKLNDGIFEMILVRKVSGVADAFRLLGKIIKQEYDGDKIITLKASEFKIKSVDALPWTLDGEFGGKHNELLIKVFDKKINLVAPANKYFLAAKSARLPEDDDFEAGEAEETRKEKRQQKKNEKALKKFE